MTFSQPSMGLNKVRVVAVIRVGVIHFGFFGQTSVTACISFIEILCFECIMLSVYYDYFFAVVVVCLILLID